MCATAESCQIENFRRSQWRHFREHDTISASVLANWQNRVHHNGVLDIYGTAI